MFPYIPAIKGAQSLNTDGIGASFLIMVPFSWPKGVDCSRSKYIFIFFF